MPLPSTPQQHEFLSSPAVQDFSEWLGSRWWVDDRLTHSIRDRRSGNERRFSSLLDACNQYEWKGQNLSGTRETLLPLRRCLRESLKANDERATADACKKILHWGGVSAHNDRWIDRHRSRLIDHLRQDRARLISARDLEQLIRFNSGFAKIQAMLVDGLIIYDSRVGAALGDLVLRYAENRSLQSIPSDLCFPWDSAKEGKNARRPKNRNPSRGRLILPRIRNDTDRATWALRASWLLERLQHHPDESKTIKTSRTGDTRRGCGYHEQGDPLT